MHFTGFEPVDRNLERIADMRYLRLVVINCTGYRYMAIVYW